MKLDGPMTFIDKHNKLKAHVFFNQEKMINGKIYTFKGDGIDAREPNKLSAIKGIDEKLDTVTGNWLSNVLINK